MIAEFCVSFIYTAHSEPFSFVSAPNSCSHTSKCLDYLLRMVLDSLNQFEMPLNAYPSSSNCEGRGTVASGANGLINFFLGWSSSSSVLFSFDFAREVPIFSPLDELDAFVD